MRTFWILTFGFHLGMMLSQSEVGKNVPGCGDTETLEAPPQEKPPYYEYKDEEGCTQKVLESWFQAGERSTGRGQKKRGHGRRPSRVLRTVDCRKNCTVGITALPDGHLCLVPRGDPFTRGGAIKYGCYLGDCASGHCQHRYETVSCRLPAPDTTAKPYYVTPEK
uniref:Evasin n=1 Tax=Amblyomma triste TaxID=251400 RepID=A0A023G8Q8_AMBTT